MDSDDKKEREGIWPSRTGLDWSELMKDATPEDVARALLCPSRLLQPEESSHKEERCDEVSSVVKSRKKKPE